MIYIITHKKYKQIIDDGLYKNILVGARNREVNGNWLKDDEGINISEKNSNYCELTGIYWIWKNTSDNVVGVCHYRRYFCEKYLHAKTTLLSRKSVDNYLCECDIIMPRKVWFHGKTALDFYKKYHDINAWNLMVDTIIKKYPNYKYDIEWFEGQKRGYCYNMFITNKMVFDKYCEWLFDILFELEKHINVEKYGVYNKRVYGFLAERMINIWIHHNKLCVVELPVYNSELFSMLWNKTQKYIERKIYRITDY